MSNLYCINQKKQYFKQPVSWQVFKLYLNYILTTCQQAGILTTFEQYKYLTTKMRVAPFFRSIRQLMFNVNFFALKL